MSSIHPALGNVLACLASEELAYRHRVARSPRIIGDAVTWRWTGRKSRGKHVEKSSTKPITADGAEAAIDRLHRDGLYPWAPGDGPRWWCDRLRGGLPGECDDCDGRSKALPEIDEFVAAASFGGPALLRAAGLAGVFAPGRRVVWRAMPCHEISSHHSAISNSSILFYGEEVRNAFSYREFMWSNGNVMQSWPSKCPYDHPAIVAAWPSIRSLARSDGQYRPTGMHLIALDDKFVTIGLERP